MSNALKLLRLTFSVIVFCTGVLLLIHSATVYNEALNVTRDNYKDKQIYQLYNDKDMEVVSYAELIATLCNSLEYDIAIDGASIDKDNFKLENVQNYNIRNTNYNKSYEYDDYGIINIVIYTGK
jgi:hypothetical protein